MSKKSLYVLAAGILILGGTTYFLSSSESFQGRFSGSGGSTKVEVKPVFSVSGIAYNSDQNVFEVIYCAKNTSTLDKAVYSGDLMQVNFNGISETGLSVADVTDGCNQAYQTGDITETYGIVDSDTYKVTARIDHNSKFKELKETDNEISIDVDVAFKSKFDIEVASITYNSEEDKLYTRICAYYIDEPGFNSTEDGEYSIDFEGNIDTVDLYPMTGISEGCQDYGMEDTLADILDANSLEPEDEWVYWDTLEVSVFADAMNIHEEADESNNELTESVQITY